MGVVVVVIPVAAPLHTTPNLQNNTAAALWCDELNEMIVASILLALLSMAVV